MGENHFTEWPTALYGFVLLMCAVAYSILLNTLITHHGKNSNLAKAIGSDKKGKISLVLYILAIAMSLIYSWIGFAIYLVVAAIWFIPDMRIEKKIQNGEIGPKD